MERRLAAILAADVAGYSRLTGADEEGTLAALARLRGEIVDPAIARGVCISAAVHEQVRDVRDRLSSLRFADGGEHVLRDIVRAVRIWRLAPPATARRVVSARRSRG